MQKISLITFSIACLFLQVQAAYGTEAPNLIIILTDDQGYQDVGFNGCTDIPTPHLDRIAQNGVKFTSGYVTFPVCGPSRAGLLTGRYQDRFGFTTNPSIDPENATSGLPLEEETIAQVLKKVGYTNAVIGKWHMGTHPDFHPHQRGFDHFFGFLAGGLNYLPQQLTLHDFSEVTRKWEWYHMKIERDGEKIEIDEYLTDALTNAATAFIDKQAKADTGPFFLYLAYNAPHTPLQATEKYLSRFEDIEDIKRRKYAAMVSAVDDGVGRILATLEKHDIEEDTLIFFLSDNGGAANNASRNTPLRGHKSTMFEGGLRVPFAMQWKGTVPAGQTFEHPVISLDIMATIVELSAAPIAPERPLDGRNLLPYLTGRKDGLPHEVLFWRKHETGGMAVRRGSEKLLSPKDHTSGNYLLFNVARDISENNELNKSHPERTEALLQEWDRWNALMKDRVFKTLREDKWWTRNILE